MSFRKRQLAQRRRKNKNLRSNTSTDENPENGSRSRTSFNNRNRRAKTLTKKKDFRDKSKGRTSPKTPSGLHTNGGEFTLNGKPYVGNYHIMSDGRAMTGSRHKLGKRRKQKVLTKITTPPTPPPSTTPSTPTGKYKKPNVKIPPKPARTPLTGVINPPYKELAAYVNQYPATDSEVKEASSTNISSYYSGGSARGHRGARETISLSQPGVQSATVRSELNINFVINLDGTNYTSSQLSNKIARARNEGNWYYLNSIPVINFNSSEVPPLSGNLFKAEEDYAFNAPTDQIDSLEEKLKVIDWTIRKQAQVENPLPYSGRYDTASVVAGRITLDEIIASVGKPPKIRWRTQ